MAMQIPQTPRIFPSHLQAFHPFNAINHGIYTTSTVKILGTVTAVRGNMATVTCGQHGDVAVIIKPDSKLQMGRLVEIIGKVTELEDMQGTVLRLLAFKDWGNPADCDYTIYELLVEMNHRFREIFYDWKQVDNNE